jgi:hypothetical protein
VDSPVPSGQKRKDDGSYVPGRSTLPGPFNVEVGQNLPAGMIIVMSLRFIPGVGWRNVVVETIHNIGEKK